MFTILLVSLIIVAVLMIGLILLQKSEGSGMSGSSAAAMFGGALTGAAAGNFLTKATAWLATIFFVLCAALALVSAKMNTAAQQSELRQELVGQGADTLIDATATVSDDAAPVAVDAESETKTDAE